MPSSLCIILASGPQKHRRRTILAFSENAVGRYLNRGGGYLNQETYCSATSYGCGCLP